MTSSKAFAPLIVLIGLILSGGLSAATGQVGPLPGGHQPAIGTAGPDHHTDVPLDGTRLAHIAKRHAEPPVAGKAPQKAKQVLAEIQNRNGEPPPGYVGGRLFQNRERQLPPGSYREYDVNPRVRGRNRGAERIVIEQRTGKAYYSNDHYQTFIPMN